MSAPQRTDRSRRNDPCRRRWSRGSIFAVKTEHCSGKCRFEGQVFGLAVANGRLFASTDEGTIHCFRPSDVEADSLLSWSGEDATMTANEETLAKFRCGIQREDRDEDRRGLLGHWSVHREMSAAARRRGASNGDQRLSDLTGNSHAIVSGDVQIREVGGVEALEFDGETNTALITDDLTRALLPKQHR